MLSLNTNEHKATAPENTRLRHSLQACPSRPERRTRVGSSKAYPQLIKEGKIKRDKKNSAIIRSADKSRYGQLPDGWKLTSLGNLFNLQAGNFIKASNISTSTDNLLNSYPCYGGNGLRGYVKKYNWVGDYPFIGRQGALCGNLNYATGKFYATERAVVVECFANTNPRWAFYFLNKMELNQYATGDSATWSFSKNNK